MTYSPKEPIKNDKLSVSQPKLNVNFTQINTQFSVNHVAFDDATANKGKHIFATFVEQAEVPETLADEYIIFSQDDDGETELYARAESNATEYQITKDGDLFTRVTPVVAVNFDNTATAVPGLGAVNGTALNVASIAQPTPGRFVIKFTTPVAVDNNYFWSVSGFKASGGLLSSTVMPSGDYNSVVKTDEITLDFTDVGGTLVSDLTRACLLVRRVQ